MKGNLAGSWLARKQVQKARDGRLVADLNKWKVTTRELGAALLGLERTPSNLKIVERRYHRLGKYKLHQVVQDGVTYNVTLAIPKSKAEHAQLSHRYMAAWRSSTLHRAGIIPDLRINGSELDEQHRGQRDAIIFDEMYHFSVNKAGVAEYSLFFEDETGDSDFYAILPKCRKIYEQYKALMVKYQTKQFFVVWNCKDPDWVWAINTAIHSLPLETQKFFLINSEAKIDPFRPDSVGEAIYLSPADNQYHPLLG
jgi:hypothetical protein